MRSSSSRDDGDDDGDDERKTEASSSVASEVAEIEQQNVRDQLGREEVEAGEWV